MVAIIYKNEQNKRIPSVTTILGILDKPALLYWAWDLGMQGIDYREKRDRAASLGTLVHHIVECTLKNTKIDYTGYGENLVDEANNAIIPFLEWFESQEFELIGSELSLVSEKLQYGGTIDIFAKLNGKNTLIDIKTSKSIYEAHKIQVAAYSQLLQENGYNVEEVAILKIDKETCKDVEYTQIASDIIEAGTRVFNNLIPVYQDLKLLRKG